MEEEELVQALKVTAVPDIYCNEYRTWLRAHLLQRSVVHRPAVIVLMDNLKSMAGMMITILRPQTKIDKVVTYGTLALVVILVALFVGVLPYANNKANVALAESIIKNDPGVALLFQDDEITKISVTNIEGNIATAEIDGTSGKKIKITIHLKDGKLEIISIPPYPTSNTIDITHTDNGKKIITFLYTNSQVNEILSQGAIIAGIFQSYYVESSGSNDGRTVTFKMVNDDNQARAMLVTTSTKWTITLDVVDYENIKIINVTSGSVVESVNP